METKNIGTLLLGQPAVTSHSNFNSLISDSGNLPLAASGDMMYSGLSKDSTLEAAN